MPGPPRASAGAAARGALAGPLGTSLALLLILLVTSPICLPGEGEAEATSSSGFYGLDGLGEFYGALHEPPGPPPPPSPPPPPLPPPSPPPPPPPDTVPPAFVTTYPRVNGTGPKILSITVQVTEAAFVYYLVSAPGSDVPSVAEVVRGEGYGGVSPTTAGSFSVAAGYNATTGGPVGGLEPGSTYRVDLVLADADPPHVPTGFVTSLFGTTARCAPGFSCPAGEDLWPEKAECTCVTPLRLDIYAPPAAFLYTAHTVRLQLAAGLGLGLQQVEFDFVLGNGTVAVALFPLDAAGQQAESATAGIVSALSAGLVVLGAPLNITTLHHVTASAPGAGVVQPLVPDTVIKPLSRPQHNAITMAAGDEPGRVATAPPGYIVRAPSAGEHARFNFTAYIGGTVLQPGGVACLTCTFECKLDLGAWAACSSPAQYDHLADGEHTFQARAVGPGGRVDPTPAYYTWTSLFALETGFVGAPPAVIRHSNISLTVRANRPAAVFEYLLDAGTAWAPLTGAVLSLSGLSPGTHTVRVRSLEGGQVDATPAVATFVYDSLPPSTALTGGPAAGSSLHSEVLNFTFSSAEPGAAFQCRLARGSDNATSPAPLQDWAPCSSPLFLSGGLSLLAGAHTFLVRAVDAAGNVDPSPPSVAFTVDPSLPLTPRVAAAPAALEDASTTVVLEAASGTTTHFHVTNITGGRLFYRNGTEVLNGTFVAAEEGAAGLVFTPGGDLHSGDAAGSTFGFDAQASNAAGAGGLGGRKVRAEVAVAPANDAPVLDTSYYFAMAAVPFYSGAGTSFGDAVGDLVRPGFSDADILSGGGGADAPGVAVVGQDASRGRWEFSVDGGATWLLLNASTSRATVLGATSRDRVRFLPLAASSGGAPSGDVPFTASVAFVLWDGTTGHASGDSYRLIGPPAPPGPGEGGGDDDDDDDDDEVLAVYGPFYGLQEGGLRRGMVEGLPDARGEAVGGGLSPVPPPLTPGDGEDFYGYSPPEPPPPPAPPGYISALLNPLLNPPPPPAAPDPCDAAGVTCVYIDDALAFTPGGAFSEMAATAVVQVRGLQHAGLVRATAAATAAVEAEMEALEACPPPYPTAVELHGNSTAQHVSLRHPAFLVPDTPPPWTVEAWVMKTEWLGSNTLLNARSGSSLLLEQQPASGRVGVRVSNYFVNYTDHAFDFAAPLGEWVHLAFVGTPEGRIHLYAGGRHQGSVQASITLPMDSIGGEGKLSAFRIDELRAWSVVRTPEQIVRFAERALGGAELGLLVYVRFDEGCNASSADQAKGHHPATLLGGARWVRAREFACASLVEVAPARGRVGGGTELTLRGEGFVTPARDARCEFGGGTATGAPISTPATVVSVEEVTCAAPAWGGGVGAVPVCYVDPGRGCRSAPLPAAHDAAGARMVEREPVHFAYAEARASSSYPRAVLAGGGGVVYIQGGGFHPRATVCRFRPLHEEEPAALAGLPVVPARFVSSTLVACEAPAAPAGAGPAAIDVSINGGVEWVRSAHLRVRYEAVALDASPSGGGPSPARGPEGGGTLVEARLEAVAPEPVRPAAWDGPAGASTSVWCRFGTTHVLATPGRVHRVTCLAPAHAPAAGGLLFQVSAAPLEPGAAAARPFVYAAPPAVAELSPGAVALPPGGEAMVTVRGAGFTAWGTGALPVGPACRFNGGAAVGATFVSAEAILCGAPPSLAGLALVEVTANGLDYVPGGGFWFLPAPAVAPAPGAVLAEGGGGLVWLSGSGVPPPGALDCAGAYCAFDASEASAAAATTVPALAVSSALVVCETPAVAAPGAVALLSAGWAEGGASAAGGAGAGRGGEAALPVVAASSVTSAAPGVGVASGGVVVEIEGENLPAAHAGAMRCHFGTVHVALREASAPTAARISCVAPAHAAGTVPLVVTTAGAQAEPAAGEGLVFSFSARPEATALEVAGGAQGEAAAAGGVVVTIFGAGFGALAPAGLACRFAGGAGAGGGVSAPATLSAGGMAAACSPPASFPAGFVAVEVVAGGHVVAPAAGLQFLFQPRAAVVSLVHPADGALVMVGEEVRALDLSNLTTVAVRGRMLQGPDVWCRFGGEEEEARGRFLGSALVVCPLPDPARLGSTVRVEVSGDGAAWTEGVEARLHSPKPMAMGGGSG